MKNITPRTVHLLSLIAVSALGPAAMPRAGAATNLLKVYIGGSYGHADVRAQDTDLISALPDSAFVGSQLGSFDISHSAYQISVGVRALEVLGAEVDYFDLGSGRASPSWSGAVGEVTSAYVSQKGETAFGVLYLPVPIVDAYVKAGVARLTTDLSATATYGCAPTQPCPFFCVVGQPCGGYSDSAALHTTETAFAAGAGVEWKLGDWAIRGEYERFTALGEHPNLVSVGATWSFP